MPQKKIIVIIEDEPDTNEMFAEMMRISGFDVEKVYSGEISVDDIAAMRPAVLVLDWMLPGQSGISLLKQMRADERLREVPVVMVSARHQAEDVAEALRAGATLFLPKPVTFTDLQQAVLSVTNSKKDI